MELTTFRNWEDAYLHPSSPIPQGWRDAGRGGELIEGARLGNPSLKALHSHPGLTFTPQASPDHSKPHDLQALGLLIAPDSLQV